MASQNIITISFPKEQHDEIFELSKKFRVPVSKFIRILMDIEDLDDKELTKTIRNEWKNYLKNRGKKSEQIHN